MGGGDCGAGRYPHIHVNGALKSNVVQSLEGQESQEELNIFIYDWDGKVVSPARKMVALYIQKMDLAILSSGKSRLGEALLGAGLQKFAGEDDALDEQVFAKDIAPLLGINGKLQVENEVSDLDGNCGTI